MKPFSELLIDFKRKADAISKLNDSLPRIIGNECVREVKANFSKQGYDDGKGVSTWKPRKASTNKYYDSLKGHKGSVYSSQNKLLLQTRNLYNAISYKAEGKMVTIGVNTAAVPYAEWVNNLRQYIPNPNEQPNVKMLTAIKKKLDYEQDKIIKG